MTGPFFVEGADIFQLELAEASWIHGTEEVFYSRRIGRPVQGPVPSGAIYSEFRPASRILGAAKLSGKTGSGWALGALTGAASDVVMELRQLTRGSSSVSSDDDR